MNFTFILSLISGAVGGNFAGGVFKSLNLGLLGNSIAGATGGFLGLKALEVAMGAINTSNHLVGRDGANTSTVVLVIVACGLGGALATIVFGAIRNRMNRS